MKVAKNIGQTQSQQVLILSLSPEEAAMSDKQVVEHQDLFAPRGGRFWGGSVIERRAGLRSERVYVKVALWKD